MKRHQDKPSSSPSFKTPSPSGPCHKKRRRTPRHNPPRQRIYLPKILPNKHHTPPLQTDAYAPALLKEINRITSSSTTATTAVASTKSHRTAKIGWNDLGIGDMVLLRVASSSDDAKHDGWNSITTPPKKFRVDKNRPWYPFECPHAPCQILAIYESNDSNDSNDDDDDNDEQDGTIHNKKRKRKTIKDQNKQEKKNFQMVVRWFFRKSEVRGATWVGQDKKGIEWKELISRTCVEEIVEADEHAVQDGILPEMLLARVVLVDDWKKEEEEEEEKGEEERTTRCGKLGVAVGKDGVPIVKYICKSFLSQDKKISIVSRETGQCHFEQDGHGASKMHGRLDKMMDDWIRRGNDVFSTRRIGRGLQCLDVDQEQRILFFEEWCRSHSHSHSRGDTSNVLDEHESNSCGMKSESDLESESHASLREKHDMEEGYQDNDASDNDSAQLSTSISVSMWSTQLPYHVDVSAQRAFYRSMTVVPPFHVYAVESNIDVEKDEWTVKMGDVVAIQVDECDMKRHKGKGMSKELLNHPYKVPWWCAEVVAIYRDLESVEEAMELRKETTKDCQGGGGGDESSILSEYETHGEFHLELRWFYRLKDIPGFKNVKARKKDLANSNALEELFETDDVDVFPADTLLGPISLHSDPYGKHPTITYENGMPVVHFVCYRFWTIFRKTLMPAGSSDTRLQRSMMYSNYLKKGSATRASYDGESETKKSFPDSSRVDIDWMAEFTNTISKLNLAESSSVNYGGDVIGRETQQAQIKKFLYSSLTATNDHVSRGTSLSNAFSLFIAGPPGTGKTASVNSIIHQMYHEQAEGLIPEFTFVSINGMEMRHPFDIYVRLWEAVSPSKEVLDRPKSLAKLQLYFSESSAKKAGHEDTSRRNNRKAVILLVDEIDYIVTEKQTILYNIFDWPLTGYEKKSDAQLIVIGISNTLNLPERLHPRLVSRIGKERCIFKSYTWSESLTIIEGKLGQSISSGDSIFHADAIKFASKKIALESGDIRKMFQLCKSAAENVFFEIKSGKRKLESNAVSGKGVIGVTDIQNAAKQMFHTVLYLAVTHATAYQALLFVALASLHSSTGRKTVGFTLDEVIIKMESMANSFGNSRYLPPPQYNMVMSMLSPLGEAGILKLSTCNGTRMPSGTSGFQRLISLKIEANEVLSSLKDTVHFELAKKYLHYT